MAATRVRMVDRPWTTTWGGPLSGTASLTGSVAVSESGVSSFSAVSTASARFRSSSRWLRSARCWPRGSNTPPATRPAMVVPATSTTFTRRNVPDQPVRRGNHPPLSCLPMETRTLDLPTPDGPMPCYEAIPEEAESTRRGGVVVIQEAFGVNPHVEDVTRRFAEAGYHAVAPHLFHRTGSPVFGYEDFSMVMEHMGAITDEGIITDVGAALDHLEEAG